MTKEQEANEPSDLFDVECRGDTVVLTPKDEMDELHSEAVSRGFQRTRRQLKQTDFRHLVLDFERTRYFGSTALNHFIALWNEVQDRDGQMAFCGLSPHEQEILKITKLDHRWLICSSRDDALKTVIQDTTLDSSFD